VSATLKPAAPFTAVTTVGAEVFPLSSLRNPHWTNVHLSATSTSA
jgi:hypothetical protein